MAFLLALRFELRFGQLDNELPVALAGEALAGRTQVGLRVGR
jgi:hypothetical protein